MSELASEPASTARDLADRFHQRWLAANPFAATMAILGPSSHRAESPKQDVQVMLCYDRLGINTPVTSALQGVSLTGLRMEMVQMQDARFHEWLGQNVFGRRPATVSLQIADICHSRPVISASAGFHPSLECPSLPAWSI